VFSKIVAALSLKKTAVRVDPPRLAWQVGSISSRVDPLVALTGMTTHGRDAIDTLLHRHGLRVPVHLELDAVLHREPGNAVDPLAVAVLAEGERVAYLPGYVAGALDLPIGAAHSVRVQLFAKEQDGATRALGWVWLGAGDPQWQYDATNWPAITRDGKRSSDHHRRREMVAVDEGGERAAQFQAGMVEGIHYLELVEPIQQLKREGRNEEALRLCYAAITGAEGDNALDGLTPPPWYTEQAAIVLRKLRRRDEELAVLRRYLAILPAADRSSTRIAERLRKLEARTNGAVPT
jgi:hypothetical protein